MPASRMLTWVLAALLILVALLAIPITLTFQFSVPRSRQEGTLLQWAFGLVELRIPAVGSTERSTDGDKSGRSDGNGRNVLAAVRVRAFRRRIVRFICDLWRAIHKRDVALRIRLGLEDPADTGQLWAALGPMAAMLATLPSVAIALEPDFSKSVFELDSSGSIRIIPLQLIYLSVALLLSPAFWRGVVRMRAGGS